MSNALRTRTLRRRCNSSDADAVREVVAAMARDIEAGGVPAKKGRGPPQRAPRAPPRPANRAKFDPEAAWRGAAPSLIAVVVSDEAGGEHVVHVFDDAARAADALEAVQAYLGSARDTGAPVSLALRFDDSGADEVLVFLCLVLL